MAKPKNKAEAIRKGKQLLPDAGDRADAYFAAAALLDNHCDKKKGEKAYDKAKHFEPIKNQLEAWNVKGLAGRTIAGAASTLGLAPRATRKTAGTKTGSKTTGGTGAATTIETLVERIEQLQAQFSKLPKSNVAEFAHIGENGKQLAAFMNLTFQHEREEAEYELPKELKGFFGA